MSNPELNRSIEAILMVVEEPVSEVVLAQIIEAPTEQVLEALHALSAEYESQGRGFALKQIAGGWRFYSHPDLAPLVEKFVLDGQQAKLTQAALETLAVIAYRQPISGAILYRTTHYFLERIGINRVEDLPALAPFLPNIDGLDEVIASLTE
jgi:segregation and condensation protein B